MEGLVFKVGLGLHYAKILDAWLWHMSAYMHRAKYMMHIPPSQGLGPQMGFWLHGLGNVGVPSLPAQRERLGTLMPWPGGLPHASPAPCLAWGSSLTNDGQRQICDSPFLAHFLHNLVNSPTRPAQKFPTFPALPSPTPIWPDLSRLPDTKSGRKLGLLTTRGWEGVWSLESPTSWLLSWVRGFGSGESG